MRWGGERGWDGASKLCYGILTDSLKLFIKSLCITKFKITLSILSAFLDELTNDLLKIIPDVKIYLHIFCQDKKISLCLYLFSKLI